MLQLPNIREIFSRAVICRAAVKMAMDPEEQTMPINSVVDIVSFSIVLHVNYLHWNQIKIHFDFGDFKSIVWLQRSEQ